MNLQAAYIFAVDGYTALLHIVEPRQQISQCCFAATRLPDDHVYLAVLEGCIHVVEDSYAVLKRLYYVYSTNQFTFYLSINGW